MSAGCIRSSGTPAFDYADILVPAQQPPDFHSTAARLLWKTLILKPACRSNYTPVAGTIHTSPTIAWWRSPVQ